MKTSRQETGQEIRKRVLASLHKLADERDAEYRHFNARIVYGDAAAEKEKYVIGIRLPAMRKFAKELAGEGRGMEVLEAYGISDTKKKNCIMPDVAGKGAVCDGEVFYEETMLQGLLIGNVKVSVAERIALYEKFIPKIDNWAVNDTACSTNKWIKQLLAAELKSCFEWLQKLARSKDEFRSRFGVIMLMNSFLLEDYVSSVLESSLAAAEFSCAAYKKNAAKPVYYTEMAVAWCFATAAAKFPDETLSFLKKKRSAVGQRIMKMTAQKCRDSFRISAELKLKISELV